MKNNFKNVKGHSYTKIYRSYLSIIYRCYDENNKDYRYYGARDIKMCNEWKNDFSKYYDWAISNGYQNGLTIDRINANGNYEPSNCRWITKEENCRFKRTTNEIIVNGIRKSGNQWSKELGRGKNYINNMIKKKGLQYTINYIKDYL